MKFFRVYCKDSISQFGDVERENNIDREVGNSIENVYATPHAQCAANMVAWNNDKAWEFDGGHMSDSVILVIESDDYYRPEKNNNFDMSTDRDEVIIKKGKIIKKYKASFDDHQRFSNEYNVKIEGIYKCVAVYPNN